MTSNLITQPYNVILNPTGGGGRAKPVANGKFYVGEIDKDPVNNPRTDLAYVDESGTERPLTSPLITNSSGAFVASNSDGKIIQPYMKNGLGYSVLIADKNGNSVYSDLNIGDKKRISDITNMLYRALGDNSAFENMISANPVQSNLGDIASTGGTLWKRIAVSIPTVGSDFEPLTTVMADDFRSPLLPIETSIQAALDQIRPTGGVVNGGKGDLQLKGVSPIYIPEGVTLEFWGPENPWDPSSSVPCSRVITGDPDSVGGYAGARWTDIDGGSTDKTNFRPLFVYETSSSRLENVTIIDNTGKWDCPIFVPALKRVSGHRITTRGLWKECAGPYLDATWSDINTTLKTLHPSIKADAGLNECIFTESFFKGIWGLKLKGTTRNPDDYTNSTWLWSWGGCSDITIFGIRFSTDEDISQSIRNTDGGSIYIDAGIKNYTSAANRIWFNNCSFRVVSTRYNVYLDNASTIQFSQCSGESIGSNPNWVTLNAPFYVTDNTTNVFRDQDSIAAEIEYNGVGYARTWENNGTRPNIFITSGLDGEISTSVAFRGNKSTDSTIHLSGGGHLFRDMTQNKLIASLFENSLELPTDNPRIYATGGPLRLESNNSSRSIKMRPNRVDTMEFVNGTSIFYGALRPSVDGGRFIGTGGFAIQGFYMKTQDGSKTFEVQLNNAGNGFVFNKV